MYNKLIYRQLLFLHQQDIFEAIEILNADDSYRLHEATYPFRDLILNDNGLLHLPNYEGKLVPITHTSIDKQIKKELG